MKTWKRPPNSLANSSACCFNGATSMKTWKRSAADSQQNQNGSCFNGATSMKTWKRAIERGDERAVEMLQWGHVDEDVEEHMSMRRPNRSSRAASMGPRR